MTPLRKPLALAAGFLCAAAGWWSLRAQQNFDNVKVHVEKVQGNVYLFAGAGGNTTVQVGSEGVLLVDTQFEAMAPKLMAEIRKLSQGPISFIINTHLHPDHVGGNAAFVKLANPTPVDPLKIVAHENVLNRLTSAREGAASMAPEGLPQDEYFSPFKNMHFNGEAIVLYHEPKAHTDGDTIVLFRGSDVISTGDIFTPGGYPFIDIANGGSVQGEIAALNHILQLAVPAKTQEGGTYVIPGHGRICDDADVVEYRDMVVIVRDRVRDLMKKGMTLEQIQQSKPTRDYDTEYISKNSFVTADRFVEAMYKSLAAPGASK